MKRIIILFTLLTGLCSCNKFLDNTPKGYRLLKTANDYDLWLNNVVLFATSSVAQVNYLADNIDIINYQAGSTSSRDLIYTWAPQFTQDVTEPAVIWSTHYATIYYFNEVISNVLKADGGALQKQQLYAEGLLGRALEYLYLVNLYGKTYDAATAGNDPGVPWVTTTNISAPVPARSSVKEVYDHIINDLNQAAADLPDNAKNYYRGSKSAAYSVLARTYLLMRDYPNAQKYATLALSADPTRSIINYNTSTILPNVTVSTESIYCRNFGLGGNLLDIPYPNYMATNFMSLFSNTDLRLQVFYKVYSPATNIGTNINSTTNLTDRGKIFYNYNTNSNNSNALNTGTSVPEMKLIIAEAAARAGDLTTALEKLDDLRKNRFSNSSYQPLASSDKEVVLNWTLRERQLEMPFIGVRWFDMRRLSAEGRMSTVQRLYGNGTPFATLSPGGNAYTLKIPDAVLRFNPDMPQNP